MLLSPETTAAVILNYNGAADTLACLRALYAMKSPPGRVIVVDNASTDTSVDRISEAWKKIAPFIVSSFGSGKAPTESSSAVLLLLPENNGYAAGNNAGIRLAMRDADLSAFWILNNDTEPDPGALLALCDRLNTACNAGIAGSTLVYAHDKGITQCAGGSRFNHWFGISRALHAGEASSRVRALPPERVESSLGDIYGASMLIRKKVIDRIGFFREDFFLYCEETEFCVRAQKAGIGFAWAPESIVAHKEGSSTGARTAAGEQRTFSRPAWVDYLTLRNRARLIRDQYPCAIPFLCCSYAVVIARRLCRGQPDRIPLVLKALWNGLAGSMGKPEQRR